MHGEIFPSYQSFVTQWKSSDRHLTKSQPTGMYVTGTLSSFQQMFLGQLFSHLTPQSTGLHRCSDTASIRHEHLTSSKEAAQSPATTSSLPSFQATKMVGLLGSDSMETSLTATNSACSALILLVSCSQNSGSQGLWHCTWASQGQTPNQTSLSQSTHLVSSKTRLCREGYWAWHNVFIPD